MNNDHLNNDNNDELMQISHIKKNTRTHITKALNNRLINIHIK